MVSVNYIHVQATGNAEERGLHVMKTVQLSQSSFKLLAFNNKQSCQRKQFKLSHLITNFLQKCQIFSKYYLLHSWPVSAPGRPRIEIYDKISGASQRDDVRH